jgi:hypothetical protein
MPDGSRKRRFSANQARRHWYAQHRSRRFGRRFGIQASDLSLATRQSLSSRGVVALCHA